MRSISVSTVAGVLGASTSAAVRGRRGRRASAAWPSPPGSRRDATATDVRSPSSSPPASSRRRSSGRTTPRSCFVPIAVTWPTVAPAWFFGYAVWFLGALAPKPTAQDVCCRPPDVPGQAWGWSHSEPAIWYPAGVMLIVAAVAAALSLTRQRVR